MISGYLDLIDKTGSNMKSPLRNCNSQVKLLHLPEAWTGSKLDSIRSRHSPVILLHLPEAQTWSGLDPIV